MSIGLGMPGFFSMFQMPMGDVLTSRFLFLENYFFFRGGRRAGGEEDGKVGSSITFTQKKEESLFQGMKE